MRLSVIIPTLNAGPRFQNLLTMLRGQVVEISEIIVIDSGSEDNTVAVARTFDARVLSVSPGEFDHGATRNYAASYAGGEIVVFMTQDAFPKDEYTFKKLVMPFSDPEVAVSYARQVAGEKAKISEQYLRLHNYPCYSLMKTKKDIQNMGIKTFQNSNVCAAYNMDIYNALGGFPEPVVCNEDMLYAVKSISSGYKVAYIAEAVVLHTHNYSISNLFNRYYDIAVSLQAEPRIRKDKKIDSKGLDYVKGYLAFLINNKKPHYIPLAVAESMARYLGFKSGLFNKIIPLPIKKHLGMNKVYWNRIYHKV